MTDPSAHELTQLLQAWSGGDERALEKLTPLVFEELRRIAHSYMAREGSGHTLQTTALVNEVYIRLAEAKELDWQNRSHFFAVCAKLMRRILVDFARSRRSLKRGGGAAEIPFDEAFIALGAPSSDLLSLDEALNRLAEFDPRKSQVVELRFFGGLNVEETAEVLKVSPETVLRDWRLAKAWLFRALTGESRDGA